MEFTRKRFVNEMQEGKFDIYAVFVYIYTHTHIYIYTICVYRYMCTHIYICITMYKMLQYTFSKGERKRRKERARSWMDQKKRRTIRMLFFFRGQPELWRTFADVSKTAHPDSLPPGSPLLHPLLPLQVLLPPICKISILYFLNKHGRETQRTGFYCARIWPGSEVSTVCFSFKWGDVMRKRKLKAFDWSMLPFT